MLKRKSALICNIYRTSNDMTKALRDALQRLVKRYEENSHAAPIDYANMDDSSEEEISAWAAARIALAQSDAQPDQEQPAGESVMVPKVPTEEMELAGMRALRNTYKTVSGEYSREQARACFDSMLAAAPTSTNAQGAKYLRVLLTRCRNMLSHPAHWGAEEGEIAARYRLHLEVTMHLNGAASPAPTPADAAPPEDVAPLTAAPQQAAPAQPRLPCGHPAELMLASAETGEPLYCELCDDKSGRRDAERRESELTEANAVLRLELAECKETCNNLSRALAEEVNGPTFMGEPVLPAHPVEQRQAALREALTRYGFTKNQQFDTDRALVEASATPAQATQTAPLNHEQVCDMLGAGDPTADELALIRKTEAAHGITTQATQTAEPDASAQGIER